MTIFVNNNTFDLKDNNKLSQLLSELNIEVTNGIAIGVNNSVVPRSDWNNYALKENDKVLLIKASQGG